MKIPFFSLGKKQQKDHYFGLLLKENKGIGYIIESDGTALKEIAKKEFVYTNGWEQLTENIDEVLFKLENETKTRVEKTIFFLFSHLIDDKTKEIKRPYLQKIKDLTKNLEIKPIGYIECYEAVVAYLQNKEGLPPTAILIEMDETSVGVFVYKGGHKMHSHIVSRTDVITDDIQAAFDLMGNNTLLPNRLVLYNSSDLFEESTKIIAHKWSRDVFVQIPRVEIFNGEKIFEGLLSVFQQQMYHPEQIEQTRTLSVKEERYTSEVLGFVVGKDVGEEVKQKDAIREHKPESRSLDLLINKTTNPLNRLKNIISNFRLSLPYMAFNRNVLILCTAILILILGLGMFEFFIHKAQVNMFYPAVIMNKNITTTALVGETRDGFLTINEATSSIALKEVKITTGKKDIGEKAKGEVTIYNFDDKDKTISKGTVIEADNQTFSLDEEVKIAASTLASDASAKLPGKSKVKVTAVNLGPESNLDRSKRFKISDLSSSLYFGLNENAFTGGTRKSIKTVSKQDLNDLRLLLLERAKKQKKEDIFKEKNQHVALLDNLINFELSDELFSKELGEEGENISLQANAVVQYYYYDISQMNSLLVSTLTSELQTGYRVGPDDISYRVKTATEQPQSIELKIELTAQAKRYVDVEKATGSILFKPISQAQNILQSRFAAQSVTIEFKPDIPLLNTILPLFKNNISLKIDSI